ncbi:MAG: HAD family hydrolase [Thermaerobacter sp.]|nr:HAD family hydrolase [Thermaerobacter sp.]
MGDSLSRAAARPGTRIELVAVDLDGTIFAHGDEVHPRVLAALHQLVAARIRVAIATGRTARSVELFRQRWALPAGPMICYNGAEVLDLPGGQRWFVDRLPDSAARRAMELVLAGGHLAQVYIGDGLWVTRDDPRVRAYVEANHIPAEIKPGPAILDWPEPPIKILIQDEPATLARLREQMAPWAAASGVRVVNSQTDYLEVLPQAATKGRALARVAERLGVVREAVAAVGDGENDAEMLAWAGWGMAMGGGHPAALRAANVVLPPVADDGAAVGLEQYVLAERSR